MVINKRKKSSRQRGSNMHGWGSKKHRGAGHRGGRGKAGCGKKGDAMKPLIWSDKRYYGKYGFTPRRTAKDRCLNISYIEEHLDELVEKKLVTKEEDAYRVEIEKLGFDKLLGSGKVTRKYLIIAPCVSEKTARKIEGAGGRCIVIKIRRGGFLGRKEILKGFLAQERQSLSTRQKPLGFLSVTEKAGEDEKEETESSAGSDMSETETAESDVNQG